MNAPGGGGGAEQSGVAGRAIEIDFARTEADQMVDLLFDGIANAIHFREIGSLAVRANARMAFSCRNG